MLDTGGAGRTASVRDLLAAAERAFLRAEFHVAHPVLRRLQAEYGAPEAYDEAVRYDALWAALAARAGNWPRRSVGVPTPMTWRWRRAESSTPSRCMPSAG
ncbi:hypothetical protein LV779_14585 [Streptomyces thinghirensis]|nr:hypothetical protein [Streptomyces thinghirensis]